MKRRLDRRTFLRGAGRVAIGLPVLDAMLTFGGRLPRATADVGEASASGAPRRIVFLFTGNGVLVDEWRCAVSASDPRSFTLSHILEPFEPVRDRCLFLTGLPYRSGHDPRNQGVVGHPRGVSAALTGSYPGPGNMYGGNQAIGVGYPISESVDFAIARHLGTSTRFPSYYLGSHCRSGQTQLNKRPFYTSDRQPLVPVEDPRAAFEQIFADVVLGPSTGPAASRRRRRARITDAALDQFMALRCELGGDDRQRLDRHIESLASFEARIESADIPGECLVPTRPDPASREFGRVDAIARAQNDLVAAAFACDLTRVIGYQIGTPDGDAAQIYDFLGFDMNHHRVSHREGVDPIAKLKALGRWQAETIMDLVNKLRAIDDVDGTLFDHTMIVWMSEIGTSWTHDCDDVVYSIIGDGGYFRGGRYIELPGGDAYPHNRLLLHFLHAMGVGADSFGAEGYSDDGPLPDLMRS